MRYYFVYLVLIIFIISNKLFLFNEEFLILICFLSFCVSIYFKLNTTIQARFSNKINLTKSLFLNSLKNIEINLNSKNFLNSKYLEFKELFTLLKNHYNDFLIRFLNNYLNYLSNLSKSHILNKLFLFKRIEKDYSKLIFLLINKKISSISNLTYFFNNVLPVKRFKVLNRINKKILLNKI